MDGLSWVIHGGKTTMVFHKKEDAIQYIFDNPFQDLSLTTCDKYGTITKYQNDYIVSKPIRNEIELLIEELLRYHQNMMEFSDNYNDMMFQSLLYLANLMAYQSDMIFESIKCIKYMEIVKNMCKECMFTWNEEFNKRMINLSDKADSIITFIKLTRENQYE